MEMDRRSLIAGGAALLAGGSRARAAEAGQKVGYAIVGLGYYALKVILPQFERCSHSRVTALVSGDPAKARATARRYGVPEHSLYDYTSFDRIRDNPDIDVVYVILPNAMHAEFTIRAFKAGKHVLCEKPMAVSATECETMIAAGRAAKRKLMIGYRCHFEPYNREAMRLARSGAAGRIRYVRSEHGFVQGDPSKWRLKKALSGGGSLMDMGIYALQAARYMSGEEPLSVTARESTDRSDPRFHEVEDMMDWTMLFPSGAIGGCMSMYSAGQNHILAMGDRGRIELEPGTRYDGNRLWTGEDGREREIRTPPPGPGVNQFVGQLDHMAECVLTGGEPIVPGEEGLRDLKIIEAIYRSAQERTTIRL
jgi:predicted dehydrogenase